MPKRRTATGSRYTFIKKLSPQEQHVPSCESFAIVKNCKKRQANRKKESRTKSSGHGNWLCIHVEINKLSQK